MNKEERSRGTIIKSCVAGEMKNAAARLGVSVRQIRRMKERYRGIGEQSMLHGNCGRQPSKTLSVEVKRKILGIRKLSGFATVNTKHFQEILKLR